MASRKPWSPWRFLFSSLSLNVPVLLRFSRAMTEVRSTPWTPISTYAWNLGTSGFQILAIHLETVCDTKCRLGVFNIQVSTSNPNFDNETSKPASRADIFTGCMRSVISAKIIILLSRRLVRIQTCFEVSGISSWLWLNSWVECNQQNLTLNSLKIRANANDQ